LKDDQAFCLAEEHPGVAAHVSGGECVGVIEVACRNNGLIEETLQPKVTEQMPATHVSS